MHNFFYIYIITVGNNPIKPNPMDLEFTTIPIFMRFLNIMFDISFLLLYFCTSLLSLDILIGRGFDLILLMYNYHTISVNISCLFFVIIKFRKVNGDFIKHIMHFFIINCCSTQIIIIE